MAAGGRPGQLARKTGRSRAERYGLRHARGRRRRTDVDDDDADVVQPSGILGQGDELADGLGRIGAATRAAGRSRAHDRTQAVRTDQVTITGAQVAEAEIG